MRKALTVRELTMIGVFTALTAVLSQIAIPLPFTPVPISLGLVAVYISGILLKPRHAVMTQICYLLIGAAGMPVFGNFRGGVSALFGPTGGYLMVYPVMAGIVAYALNSRKSLQKDKIQKDKRLFLKAALSVCSAQALLYLGGTAWLGAITGNSFSAALGLGVYPYVTLDAIKLVFCVAVIVPLRSRLRAMNLLALDGASGNTNLK